MEVWKDVAGYEGLYQVSNLGRVKSILFRNNIVIKAREKILAQRESNSGYFMVGLHKERKVKQHYVHRLVAEAFLYSDPDAIEVNHINGNKHDNRVENLEFCKHSENIKHARKTGLLASAKGAHNKNSKSVAQYDLNMKLLARYASCGEAQRSTGVWAGNVSKAARLGCTAGGYFWKYT